MQGITPIPTEQPKTDAALEHEGEVPSDSSTTEKATSDAQAERERLDKEERDRRAKEGRERAEALRRAQAAERLATQQAAEIRELRGYVSRIGTNQAREQQARLKAHLDSLPPDERTAEELKILRQQHNALVARLAQPQTPPLAQARPPVGQGQDDESVQYFQTRSREILEEAEREFGVTIDPADPAIDWETEKTALATIRAAALLRRAQSPNGEAAMAKNQAVDVEAIKKQVREEMLAEFGVGSPNSPRAAGNVSNGPVDTESFQKVNRTYNPKQGPRAQREKLQALRDQAEAALPK